MSALLAEITDISVVGEGALRELSPSLQRGEIVPYLGPGILPEASPVPASAEALADFLGAKVALPQRARGNAWAAAQYIESNKHRATVTALMAEAFATPVPPSAFHTYLAGLSLPLIVDSWYDGVMRTALTGVANWGEVQGITRAGVNADIWFRFYEGAGTVTDAEGAANWTTLLYKPHGGITPAKNFLISDADYVETLTEIDIQTPIPEIVRDRRTTRGFLFLGCRFHDQLLRTYARQIIKRSTGPHYAVIDPTVLTRNERRFLVAEGIVPIAVETARATGILMQAA